MNFRIEVVCVREDGTEERREVLTVAKEQLAMETLGLTLAEGKALLANVQTYVVEHQTTTYLERHRRCSECGRKHQSKGQGRSTVQTLFGPVPIPNPRSPFTAAAKKLTPATSFNAHVRLGRFFAQPAYRIFPYKKFV
jgi:hypothetical protein